jgi:membrane associated rhomboid family serine protease
MRDAAVGFHCPECVADGRRTMRAARTVFGGSLAGHDGTATKVLIGINIAVMLLAAATAGVNAAGALTGARTVLHEWGAVLGAGLLREGGPPHGVAFGEYWRLVTAMFLHYGLLHLLVNMWALWVLGPHLERTLGSARFLALYLIAGIGGDVAAYVFQPFSLTAGASGAIFGLFAALFVVNRRLGRDNGGVITLIVINLLMVFIVPNISLAGHVGGLVTGGSVMLGFAYAPRGHRTQVQVAGAVMVMVLLTVITVTRTDLLLG